MKKTNTTLIQTSSRFKTSTTLYTLALFFCLSISNGFAQTEVPKTLIEKPFNSSGKETVTHIIQNKQGQYILVGTDANWFVDNDQNAFMATAEPDAPTQRIKAMPFGGKGTQQANAVVQTHDGGYIVAGFTDSEKGDKRDAWLARVTENGNEVWQQSVGTNADDEFTAISQSPNGDLWMTGESAGNLWVVRTDVHGKNQKRFPLTFPANAKTVRGNAMAWSKDGKYLIIVGVQGMRFPENQKALFFVWFDTEGGRFLNERIYPNAEGNGIIRDRLHNLAIVGTSYETPKGRILLMYTDSLGNEKWVQKMGDKATANEGKGVAEDWAGNFYAVGKYTKSRGNNAKPQGWIHKFDKDGTRVWKDSVLLGGQGEDGLNALIVEHRGGVVAVGNRYKMLKHNSWMAVIPPSVQPPNESGFKLNIVGGRFHDSLDNAILRLNANGYYDFWVENTDTLDVFGLVAHVHLAKDQTNTFIYHDDDIHIGTLRAKEKRFITIPFECRDRLVKGDWTFKVTFTAFEKELDKQHTFRIATRENAKFIIDTTHTFPAVFQASQVIDFSFTVANTGDLTANDVKLRIDLPPRVKFLSQETVLNDIEAGASKVAHFSLEVDKDYADPVLLIPFYVAVNGVRLGKRYDLVSRKFAPPPPPPLPNLPTRTRWETNRLIVVKGTDSLYNVFGNKENIEVIVEMNRPINIRDNIVILVNDQELGKDMKMDNIELKTLKATNYPFRYSVNASISLQQERTSVQIEIRDSKETVRSARLILKKQARPNLFLLTVGVNYEKNTGIRNLKYTQADAKSIDSVFAKQGESFFDTVNRESLIDPNGTSAVFIKYQINDIVEKSDSNDVIMVFLSGHGGRRDSNIIFMGSNYDRNKPQTYLDYKKDIEGPLSKAKGQKLIYIDACQTILSNNQTKQDDEFIPPKQLSEAWNDLITAQPKYRTLLSCSKGEASYEIEKYQHGAFTQALLEAFANASVLCRGEYSNKECSANLPESGGNPDHILTFQELSDFVKKRVPIIIKEHYKGATKVTQNPTVRDENPDEDIPVFWFDK